MDISHNSGIVHSPEMQITQAAGKFIAVVTPAARPPPQKLLPYRRNSSPIAANLPPPQQLFPHSGISWNLSRALPPLFVANFVRLSLGA